MGGVCYWNMNRKLFRLLFLLSFTFVFSCRNAFVEGLNPSTEALDLNSCLYYLSRASGAKGISRYCNHSGSEIVIPNENIIEFDLASISNRIVYLIRANGNDEIWMAEISGNGKEKVHSCLDEKCGNVVVSPDGSSVYFSQMSEQAALLMVDISNDSLKTISNIAVDWIDISPDGSYLRFHERQSGYLRILSTNDYAHKFSIPADIDLIGEWSSDYRKFVIGERNAQGILNVTAYSEISAEKLGKEELFNLSQGLQYYNPIFASENTFFVLMRGGLKDNTKQIVKIDRHGDQLSLISRTAFYDHSSLQWNERDGILAFQQFDPTSSESVPQIATWDQKSGDISVIAQNAVQPQWLN